MANELPAWNYPPALPVVALHDEIVAAVRACQVVVVVSDTGSGKTTQLPKMVAEALGTLGEKLRLIGCTQPRRIAATSVARRVAEELNTPLGGFVGYQVRFDEQLSAATRVKFMTDGILLAETQGDRDLKRYGAIILDEAHERSLNIDFLLGYLKELLGRRPDLKLVISSATLDAGAFAEFFNGVPVIEAPGRTFGVEEFFLPPDEDEELPQQVTRAVEWLGGIDARGDVLVFLPGEREIRECAEVLDGRKFPNTEIMPLFARLSMADQQRVFHPGSRRRVILATNVAETSLTIPGIVSVIDSGVARVSRWSPGRGVQRLQIEPVSQASARQRKGRCGRVREGICVRLYEEESLLERSEFNDPEIRRSSLAGVILRMKSLGLPDIEAFPFLDPPAPKAISEGYRTLREVGALDAKKQLTEAGRQMSRLPVDPRLGRMLLEARKEKCLVEILPIIAGLEANDPRDRPAEKQKQADAAHARWKDADSDFRALLRIWLDVAQFRDGRRWKRNQLRKFCTEHFLSFRRVLEWANVHDELVERITRDLGWKLPNVLPNEDVAYHALHRALLAGVPRQFGLWDREQKTYRSASGGFFAVFPGSALFGGKRWEWVMAMELVETSRLFARRIARIDPAWIESVAPHLCHYRYGEAHWDENQGAVYGKETVTCGGLPIVVGRRIHYGRVDAAVARHVFLHEGVIANKLKRRYPFIARIAALREEVSQLEHKLRRVGGMWSDEALAEALAAKIPQEIHTAAAFREWHDAHPHDPLSLEMADVLLDEFSADDLTDYPDTLAHGDQEYAVYYRDEAGARDDGVTLGVHIDQLPTFPAWLPEWGVPAHLRERVELLMRALPKNLRVACQPIAGNADEFCDEWHGALPEAGLFETLAQFLTRRSGFKLTARDFDAAKLPHELITKVWVCDDEGEEIAIGTDVAEMKVSLGGTLRERFEDAANEAWARRGMTRWEGDALPASIRTAGGIGFPALVDEGKSVGIRVFANDAEARESHRAGCVRLMMLEHRDQADWLRKKYPLGMMAKVELPRLATHALDELIAAAAEGALGMPMPRAPEEFAKRQGRSRWHEAAAQIGKSIDEAFDTIQSIRAWLEKHRSDRNLAEVVEDIDEQLAWLLRARFLWRGGFDKLRHYDRYFRAIRSRIGRIESLPLAKDFEKMDRVRKFWEPWQKRWTAAPDDPRLWDYGWLLEEYRISLFAPDIPCVTKVSEKLLERDEWR